MRAAFHTSVAVLALLTIPVAARAADLKPAPVYSKAPMMAPVFSWTGFYIGGNLGGAWAHRNVTDSLFGPNLNNGTNNGVFVGGGQIGGNYQFSNFVVGVEGSFDWAANNNNATTGIVVPGLGGNNSFTVTNVTTGASITGSNSNTTSGWLAGAGIEWAFANSWTLKFEYDYIGLSGRTFTVPAGSPFLVGDTFTTGSSNIQMATVGVNFLFGMH
jgi:outer membrane immunogenic protein